MANFITRKVGVKVSLKVNLVILVVMVIGTYVLLTKQSQSLEAELMSRGKIQSIVGAKIVGGILEEAIDNGVFNVNDAFDTNYQQIGNFDPPKYHTQYDTYLDKAILGLQDEFLDDASVTYAVAVDINGYLPTHNSPFQQPITGDQEKDKVGNRTKRVFNDPVGMEAAKNTVKGFRQVYYRDTGETMWDISSPIMVKGKQWGGFRVGLSLESIASAKQELITTLITIMAAILVLSIFLTFIIVNRSLAPVASLAKLANGLADGKHLGEEIAITSEDELGDLQASLDRFRLSMLIALKRKR
jgi:methyl-accepting chemotaxis protein